MASLWKHPNSPFWSACFTVRPSNLPPERWKRSLRTGDRKLAQQIADVLDDAGRNVLSEHVITAFTEKIRDAKTKAAVAQIFADVFRSAAGREFGAGSLRAFADSWLTGIKPQLSPRSYPKYKLTVQSFVSSLGGAADRDLIGFGARDDILILRFRDDLANRLAAASVNTRLKIVKQMFKAAAQRFKIESPAHFVSGVRKTTAETERRAFTLPELGRILRAARASEWEGIILAGLYTGQRLSDVAMLRWENVDLARGEIALTTRKTNRRVLLPIAAPLLDYLVDLPATDDSKAFVFPRAAARLVRCREQHSGGLSNQFHDILVSAGLVQRRSHKKAKDGSGRAARRRSSEISFHSLRHTSTSLLKNAGVPQSVVMDIIGHESRAISQIYTHVGETEKRQAMAALPSLSTLLRASDHHQSKRAKNNKRKKAA
ncbi:MAG TPA: tyrosine-type recombinase/integrase [Candidatus Udaeobacter sp.]